jgi:hypothetical protein
MQDRHLLSQSLTRALELMWDGDFFMAERLFKQFEKHRPKFPEGLFEYACFKLTQGDYEEAWPLYQNRIEMQIYLETKVVHIPRPYWDGSPSKDTTLLIHRDQGYGDIFMSARYFPLVSECLGRVLLAVPLGAGRLFRGAFPDLEVIEDGDPIPISEIDCHLHSLSLPAVFKTTLETIPSANIFTAEPELKAKWNDRLQGDFKVGLCWQGNSTQYRDAERSIPLKSMEPILSVKGVQFYGLQVGEGEDQVADLANDEALKQVSFEHLGPELKNKDVFVDVIAAMECMDLVIAVDTAIAHLAGSMGIPVWVLVGKVPYWPYLLESDSTPWYPSARLFRTRQRYKWEETIKTVAEELRKLASSD